MTIREPEWFFPPLSGGEERGLNDAGIEGFKRGERLAREVVQNCLDNRDGSHDAALVTFEYMEIPHDDFPGLARFRRVFEACREHVLSHYGTDRTAGDEKRFFENGLQLLDTNKMTIPALRIGDERTTGLIGQDHERNQPYWRLIRGQGYSSIQGPGGGTYGIGQRAPFAHSDLRTILYSTRLDNGQVAFVAKSILASFKDPDREGLTQNIGWWCYPGDSPMYEWTTIRDEKQISPCYLRDSVGTDIYVMGYTRPDWTDQIRWSVLQNFFAALAKGDLCVRIVEKGDLVDEFSKQNVAQKLSEACDDASQKQPRDEYQKGLKASLYFHRALTQPKNGEPFEKHINTLGKVKLFVYLDPDAPDRWCTMRSPRILIENNGSKILRGFAAVFLCDTDDGNKYLAGLEDPAHTRWHEDEARGWNDDQKTKARDIRLSISRFVRETLKSLREVDDDSTQDFPYLGRYLPLESDSSKQVSAGATEPTPGGTENETGHHKSKATAELFSKKKLRPLPNPGPLGNAKQDVFPALGPGDDEDGGYLLPPRKPNGEGSEGGTADHNGQQGGSADSGHSLQDPDGDILSPRQIIFRSFSLGKGRYRLVLKCSKDLGGAIRLTSIGEDNTAYAPEILEARGQGELKIADDRIEGIELTAGNRTEIEIVLDTDIPLSLALRS